VGLKLDSLGRGARQRIGFDVGNVMELLEALRFVGSDCCWLGEIRDYPGYLGEHPVSLRAQRRKRVENFEVGLRCSRP
jgi:hypothetical protein